MRKRGFSLIVCLSILMLCNCNPGDVCGPGKIIDCARNCIDESEVNNSIGDGTCDGWLNCSAFNYDDGDCNDETTTTTTVEETSSTTISVYETSTTTTINGEDLDTIESIYENMISIHGGTFEMGCSPGEEICYPDEYPIHRVTISAFKMSAYEITQGQWEAVMGSNPSHHQECGSNCPVEQVPLLYYYLDDVQDFIDELNNVTGKQYRLPTEAEWEYAARAGTKTQWYCGYEGSCLDDIAWYDFNSGTTTHPVGLKVPNAWGLYDMIGNVAEWCSDWYDSEYYHSSPSKDPPGPDKDPYGTRVTRGGSYADWPCFITASFRRGRSQDYHSMYRGFRLCLSQ